MNTPAADGEMQDVVSMIEQALLEHPRTEKEEDFLIGCHEVMTYGPEVVNSWKQASDSGDPAAKWLMGYCYWIGMGVETSKEKSLMRFREAAEADFAPAMNDFAQLVSYDESLSHEEKYLEQSSLFEGAIEKDYVPSMYTWGLRLATAGAESGWLEGIESGTDLVTRAGQYGHAAAQALVDQTNLAAQPQSSSRSMPSTLGNEANWRERDLQQFNNAWSSGQVREH
jgi:TPR repeat protein